MCSVKSVSPEIIPFTVPASPAIDILQTHSIPSFAVAHYLLERRILLSVAQRYCVEAQYLIDKKAFYVPGFRNDAGSCHLTDRDHEYSSGPQSLTFINGRLPDIAILTHPLSLMTLASLLHYASHPLPNLLVIPFPDSACPFSHPPETTTIPDLTTIGRPIIQSLPSYRCHIHHSHLYHSDKNRHRWACQIEKSCPINPKAYSVPQHVPP
jgi:hypothetical protein